MTEERFVLNQVVNKFGMEIRFTVNLYSNVNINLY